MIEKIAIVPGSFDPITLGHLDVIKRAAKLYNKVIVAVMINDQKKYMFKLSARTEMVKAAVADIENIEVISSTDMLWKIAKAHNACAIVKGIRNTIDLEYESKMAKYNIEQYPEAETIFLPANANLVDVSSTEVRERINQGKDLTELVPKPVKELIDKYFAITQVKITSVNNYFDSISIKMYNETFSPILNKAESFISNLDHALEKSDENARMQCRVIGWDDDTKIIIKAAITAYREYVKGLIK